MRNTAPGFAGLIALLVVFLVFLVLFFGLGKRQADAPEKSVDGISVPQTTPVDTLGVGIYDTGMEAKQRATDTKDLLEKKAAQTIEESER